jgi:hypothetical protein
MIKGVFRIPQVAQFLKSAHRNMSDAQLTMSSTALSVDESLVHLRPVYKKLGGFLIAMHKVEYDLTRINNHEDATIAPLLMSHSPPSEVPPSASAPPQPHFESLTRTSSQSRASNIVHPIGLGPRLQEFVHFITVSAFFDRPSDEMASHEREYNKLIEHHPERYSSFRERNRTYQSILSTLDKSDSLYLPRLILWSVYAWGLQMRVQNQLRIHTILSGILEFHEVWSKVKRREGIKLLRVTAYGGQYYGNVPMDATGMENVWNGALRCGLSGAVVCLEHSPMRKSQ